MIRAALALALAAATAAPAAERDPLAGRVAGPPQDCVPWSASGGRSSLTIADRTTLFYRENGRRTWVVHPRGACPLHVMDSVIVDVFGGQLCRNDRIRVFNVGQSIPSAPCLLDRFTPYDRVEK